MTNANAQVIERFYARRSRGATARPWPRATRPNAHFVDPVFELHAGRDRRDVGDALRARQGSARRGARHRLPTATAVARTGRRWYRSRATGRPVHNVIDATFEFDDDGRILRQHDTASTCGAGAGWRWAPRARRSAGRAR